MASFVAAAGCELSVPTVDGASGAVLTIPVTLAVRGTPVAAVQFDLQYDSGAMSVTVSDGDRIRQAGKTADSFEPGSGTKRFVIAGLNRNAIDPGALVQLSIAVRSEASAGVYALSLASPVCADPDGGAVPATSQSGAVTVQPGAAVSAIPASGILNSASLLPGPLTPGEIVTIVRPSLTVEGVTPLVTFDAVPATLFYASTGQINAMAPLLIAGPRTVLRVFSAGVLRGQADVPVAERAPGLFTQDSSGAGAAVAVNEDGSLHGTLNPAPRGSAITVFGTGLGLDPAAAGVTGTICGTDAAVESITPGAAPGVSAIRMRIPAQAAASLTCSVLLRVAGYSSQTGVTVAVQ